MTAGIGVEGVLLASLEAFAGVDMCERSTVPECIGRGLGVRFHGHPQLGQELVLFLLVREFQRDGQARTTYKNVHGSSQEMCVPLETIEQKT